MAAEDEQLHVLVLESECCGTKKLKMRRYRGPCFVNGIGCTAPHYYTRMSFDDTWCKLCCQH